MKRKILKVIYAFCISFLSVIVCLITFGGVAAHAELQNKVIIESNPEVTKGNTYYGYVYIESLENIASLNVSIQYNSDVVSITSTYNQVSCALYDSSNSNDTLSYSYIFNAGGQNSKTNLFYFMYTVSESAESLSSWFDVVIDEAYNSSLEIVNVFGSRYYFDIKDRQPVTKTCYIYGTSSVSTKIEEEFEISYRFGSYEIASGSIEIQYDRDLFEFVSLTQLSFLTDKMVDINSSIAGSVLVSFLGTEYTYNTDFLRLKFKTIGNENINTTIKLSASSFYDLDLNSISCSGTSTNVMLSYDINYDNSLSKMFLTSNYDSANNQVKVLVGLSTNSNLGAGDFALSWNKNYYQLVSFKKKFTPSFFNVNDKLTDDGKLKFSIISLTDITSATEVIEVTLNVITQHDETISVFEITGSGLSDSLTNSIYLNFVNCNQTIPGNCTYGEWTVTKEPTCTEKGEEHRVCSVCGHEETREVAAKGHSWEEEWTIDVEATCEHEGSQSHHCSNCDEKKDVTVIEKTAHQSADAVRENEVPATCTENGSYDEVVYCKDCHIEISREHKTITATGHSYGEWTVTKEPTCTEKGEEHRVCSVCGHEETREVAKLDCSQLFVDSVNAINTSSDSLETLFNKIKQALEYYKLLEDKNIVSDSVAKLQEAISVYNNQVTVMNNNHSKVSDNVFELIVGMALSMSFLALCVYFGKKGAFRL